MSQRQAQNSPWPAQTPLPTPAASSSSIRIRKRSSVRMRAQAVNLPRQTISDISQINQAKAQCEDSDNSVRSCWPIGSTVMAQAEWTQFVWNSRLPDLTQFNEVDVFLVRADSGKQLLHFSQLPNPFGRAGSVPLQANDTWWDGDDWPGHNVSFPFYFVVIPSNATFDQGIPQATFTAVQTTFADSVIAAMSTSAAFASSAALASSQSAASASAASASASASRANAPNGSAGLQNSNSDSSFPRWAIAVIVILGFFAMVAFVVYIFWIIRRMRRRRENSVSRRGSMGSQSPMMANIQGAATTSPPHPVNTLATAGAGAAFGRAGSIVSPDGASTHSDGLFSGADAAVMAEAFRKALRKPDFANRPVEEGESPEAVQDREAELMNRELAEEGRDIRSVGSSRGVKFETLSDSGDTAQDVESQQGP